MKILYTASSIATGDGRNGHVRSDDGLVDADVRTPKELGGTGGATNPEQLFASGYAACFNSALRLVARSAKADAEGSTVTAKVGIGPNASGGFQLSVELQISLPALDHVTAVSLVEKAHQVCPYSNATRGNIDVVLTVI